MEEYHRRIALIEEHIRSLTFRTLPRSAVDKALFFIANDMPPDVALTDQQRRLRNPPNTLERVSDALSFGTQSQVVLPKEADLLRSARYVRSRVLDGMSSTVETHPLVPQTRAQMDNTEPLVTIENGLILAWLEFEKKYAHWPAHKTALEWVFTNYFRARTRDFLRANKIIIRGHAAQERTLSDLNAVRPMRKYDSEIQFAPLNINVRTFYFSTAKGRYLIDGDVHARPPHSVKFQAISVPNMPWFGVFGRGDNPQPPRHEGRSFARIDGTRLVGADMMITTGFSGCAFCFQKVGDEIWAAHIAPTDGGLRSIGAAPMLARQLIGLERNVGPAGFENAPMDFPMKIYGKGYSNIPGCGGGYDNYMYLVGLRNSLQQWEFHAQITTDASQSPIARVARLA